MATAEIKVPEPRPTTVVLTMSKEQAEALAAILFRGVGGADSGPRGLLTGYANGSVLSALTDAGIDAYGMATRVEGVCLIEAA